VEKPVPDPKFRGAIQFIPMCDYIDKKYGINARDYVGHFGFDYPAFLVAQGCSPEDADRLYRTSPASATPEEQLLMKAAREAQDAHYEAHPYQDFWHYQLEVFGEDRFRNDSYQDFPIQRCLDGATEDWQKEIAKLWLDEWAEYADEDGIIFVWVSW
jgi:hypothetical protein